MSTCVSTLWHPPASSASSRRVGRAWLVRISGQAAGLFIISPFQSDGILARQPGSVHPGRPSPSTCLRSSPPFRYMRRDRKMPKARSHTIPHCHPRESGDPRPPRRAPPVHPPRVPGTLNSRPTHPTPHIHAATLLLYYSAARILYYFPPIIPTIPIVPMIPTKSPPHVHRRPSRPYCPSRPSTPSRPRRIRIGLAEGASTLTRVPRQACERNGPLW